MKLPFTKKTNRDDGVPDYSQADDFPVIDDRAGNEKSKGSPAVRIALYVGLFCVIAISIGGYLYFQSTAGLLNKKLSGSRGLSSPKINISEASRETQFAEKSNTDNASPWVNASGNQAGQPPSSPRINPADQPLQAKPDSGRTPSSTPPAGAVLSLPAPKDTKQAAPSAPVKSVHAGTQPAAPKVASGQAPADKPGQKVPAPAVHAVSADKPEVFDQLVLKDDNPFREKFLKKFQDYQVSRSLKDGKAVKFTQSARQGKPGGSPNALAPLGGSELSILPAIAGANNAREDAFRVYGVIRSQAGSIALTNRGELKEGSMIGGDAVVSVGMNEVRFKSGRVLKVSGQ